MPGYVSEENHYYPYGLLIEPISYAVKWRTPVNQYKYQDKEWQAQLGINMLDFHARQYDPVIARWIVQDPAGQFESPYLAMGNNPVIYTDPDGQWIQAAIGALIGGVSGYMMARQQGLKGWDMAKYIFGGAAIGAVSGGLSGAVAGSGMAFANTAAIITGSFTHSVGMKIMTNGQTDVNVGFGAVSYNIDNGDVGYLGEKGNSTMENVGYGFGAFTNATDITAYAMGASGSNENIDLITDEHSQFVKEGTRENIFSFGAANDDGSRIIRPELDETTFQKLTKYGFKKYGNIQTDYDNGVDGSFFRRVTIKGVNMQKLNAYKGHLNTSSKYYYKFASITPFGLGNGMHCTIAASRALLRAGVFNIPILRMPWMLDLQMRIRDYTYMSYHLNQIP